MGKLFILSGTNEIPQFSIGVRCPPEPFLEHVDDNDRDLLDQRFDKDLLWSIVGGLPDNVVPGKQLPLCGIYVFNLFIIQMLTQRS